MTSSLCLKEQIKEQFNILWQTLFIHDKKQFPQHESANNKTANNFFYIWVFVQIQKHLLAEMMHDVQNVFISV